MDHKDVRQKLTLGTGVSISLVIVLAGAVGWLTEMHMKIENVANAQSAQSERQEKNCKSLQSISDRLTRMEAILDQLPKRR